ncbi:MAG: hypothetical protein V3V22_10070 [Methylococcales bacterium]
MSKIKRHTTIFVIFLSVATGLTIVKKWQDSIPKPASQTLPLAHLESLTIKPQQAKRIINLAITKREKHLQQKIDIALADIARLQREKLVLIEKLDDNSSTKNRVEVNEDIMDVANEPFSNSIKVIQTTEQLENRFSQENQDLEWSISVEAAITNQYFDSPVNGNELLDARCQSTLCRVEISHSDHEAEALFWANISGVKGLSAQQMHTQRIEDQAQGLKTIIFVSRQGHKINSDENL